MQSAWLKYWYFQGYVTQFRFGQCGSDAVGELTCSTGHMITNIGSADMIQSEDEPDCISIVIALVNQMCDLKHYCLVPAEAINRNCQLLSGCFQVDYACKCTAHAFFLCFVNVTLLFYSY